MRSRDCAAHKHDSLVSVESHHVWPKGYHGPNIPENRVQICANAHSDTHYLMNRLLKTGGRVDWAEARTYGPKIRHLARSGYDQIIAYAESLAEES